MNDGVDELLAEGRFRKVQPDPAVVQRMAEQSSLDIEGARRELDAGNPSGAYGLLWSGARLAVTAHALVNGLKPEATGGHRAIVTYAEERLSELRRRMT